MKKIKITFLNEQQISNLAHGYNIDYPPKGLVDFKSFKNCLIGWILLKEQRTNVTITKSNEKSPPAEYNLNIERPDVIENLFNSPAQLKPSALCGFSIPIELQGKTRISIKIGANQIPWFDIEAIDRNDNTLQGLINYLKHGELDNSRLNLAHGEIGEIVNLYNKQEVTKLAAFWQRALEKGFLELDHPEIPELKTRARFSVRLTWANYIVFSDSTEKNFWVAVQVFNIIDAIITPENIYAPFMALKNLALETKRLSNILENQKLLSFSEAKFNGFTLNQTRPFHFFYDQLKWLFFLKKITPSSISSHDDKNPFFPSEFIASPLSSEKQILAYPTVINRNLILSAEDGAHAELAHTQWHKSLTEGFEKSIHDYACQFPPPTLPSSDFTLWIGISSEKRCWREQVFGYSSIINSLAKHYTKILVIMDGLTARHGQRDEHPAEDVIIKSIAVRIPPSQCTIISLSGCDYLTKIRHGKLIDMFITDAGTASFVPLRICQKPGVLHSNKTLFTFPDQYPESVQIIDKSVIQEEEPTETCSPAQISYHIHWQHIYNAAAKILNSTKIKILPYLSTPPEQKYIYNKTGAVDETMPPHQISALKSLALMFEQKNEIETAEKLIIEALKESPGDREALEKETQYRKELGIHIYKPNDDQLAMI